jgi:hypothetical protein
MPHHDSADLDWLAFQYINDELSPAEAEQFEQRLADDQAAREAVAEAVLLNEAVRAGELLPAGAHRRGWLLHAGWAAVAAAACLALALVLRSPPGEPLEPIAQLPQVSNLSEELALVWVQGLSLPDALLAEEEDLGLAIDARDAERDDVVPLWMLEALGGSQEMAPLAPERKES